jgi:ERCC4-type nuclease
MSILKFDEWIKQIVIIIDSREKSISHITDVFNSNNINYKIQKLEIGDYTFVYLDKVQKCIIERKNSLDELSQNFTKNRDRFNREFQKINDNKLHLVIENNTMNDVVCGNYRSKIHRNSFLASILSFQYKYNLNIHFIENNYTAFFITKLFYYYYVNEIKRYEED